MLDETSLAASAALVMRPILNGPASGTEAIRFGGKPRLPAHMIWPKDHYHFAQINLARLPADLTVGSDTVHLPPMPRHGTLFIFLNLVMDGVYQNNAAMVLYTPEDAGTLPERDPPVYLQDLREDEHSDVQSEGLSDCGKLLAALSAEAIPVLTERAVNPLQSNLIEAAGGDVADQRAAYDAHQTAVAAALRPDLGPQPEIFLRDKPLANKHILDFLWKYKERYVDWQFIFDWSKAFYLSCIDMALDHVKEFKDENRQKIVTWILDRKFRKKRRIAQAVHMGTQKRPVGWVHDAPAPITDPFDLQARAWMTISRLQTGTPPREVLEAFYETFEEIARHYTKIDDEGYNLGPRNTLIDLINKHHDWHAGNTLVNAKRALEHAIEEAATRDEAAMAQMSMDDRWKRMALDANIERHKYADSAHRFTLGDMPLQMFGQGFEIQSAVSENAGNILLFQLGDPSSNLPVHFGGDGILQLWIAPEDLAQGRFDRVHTSLDYT